MTLTLDITNDLMRRTEQRLGENVRIHRETLGWSQRELSEHIKHLGYPMERKTLGKLENAARATSLGEIALLASIFGCTVFELIGKEGD